MHSSDVPATKGVMLEHLDHGFPFLLAAFVQGVQKADRICGCNLSHLDDNCLSSELEIESVPWRSFSPK